MKKDRRKALKLIIELVPETCWLKGVRDHLMRPVTGIMLTAIGLTFALSAQQRSPAPRKEETITTIYLEDSMTVSDGQYPPRSNRTAFNEFSVAFAEDAECRGLTLVRFTTLEAEGKEMARTYWWLDLFPENEVSDDYGTVGWGMHATDEKHNFSWFDGVAATATKAAHKVCGIASRRNGGAVY